MDWLKNFLNSIGEPLGLSATVVGIIGLAILALVIIAIVVAICCVKSRKKKKAQTTETVREDDPAVLSAHSPVPEKEKKQEPAAATEEVSEANGENKDTEPEKETAASAPAPAEEKAEETKKEVREEPAAEEKKKSEPTVAAAEEKKKSEPTAEEKKEKPAPRKEEKKERPAAKETPRGNDRAATQQKRSNGKWYVEIKTADEYVATLAASNGEIMLHSEAYSTEEGARSGISTIIRSVGKGNFVTYSDKNGNYYFKLKGENNRLLCVGEIYKTKDQCLKAVETVKRIAGTSVILGEVVDGDRYIDYVPAPLDLTDAKKSGKWKVETCENGMYVARLYANNGQLMLSTEEVRLLKSAENAIESIKKNAAEGNFVIDRDKFGRYYYKLRNATKSVICIGEAYDSLDSCTAALESVRRFSATATVVKE